MKLVSVIIPTYNRAHMLCDCIDSILRSTYTNLEIIVVDNKSTDQTVDLVRSKYQEKAQVRIMKLKKNMMAAGGRNAGIKRANGDYLLFVDNDNIVCPDMIQRLVEEMEQDTHIGLVGPLSIDKYNNDKIWLASGDYNFFTSRPKTLYSGKRVEEVVLNKHYKTCYSPNVMMVRNDVIKAVGGFARTYLPCMKKLILDIGYKRQDIRHILLQMPEHIIWGR